MNVANGYLINIQAGENLAVGDWVFIDPADGRAYKSAATEAEQVSGLVVTAATLGNDAQIHCAGVVQDWPDTLTPGTIYYAATGGDITSTKPTSGGYQQVAVALDDNVLQIIIGAWVKQPVRTTVEVTISIDEDGGTGLYVFALAGIAVGDPVVIDVPAAYRQNRVIYEGYVSDTDEVTIKGYNNTPSTVSLDAVSFTVLVFK